ncbi:MAG: InlB B-repeat-containing protein [Clostridia bacterium]|nr:InlB B-repeat-containing protein [Clostridia bacterium]
MFKTKNICISMFLLIAFILSLSFGGVVYANTNYDYNINYYLNNGQNNAENPDGYNTGQEIILKDAVKDGYKFIGWYEDESYAESSKIEKIEVNFTKELDLYAKFEKLYSINYVLNGGNNHIDNPTEVYRSLGDVELKNASKSGFTFKGWYKNANFSAESKVTEIDSTLVNSNITLYAYFSESSIGLGAGTQNNNNNLLWLWIVLGVVWGCVLVLVILWLFVLKKTLIFKKGNYEIARVSLKWGQEIKFPKNLGDCNWCYGKNEKLFTRKKMGLFNQTVYFKGKND